MKLQFEAARQPTQHVVSFTNELLNYDCNYYNQHHSSEATYASSKMRVLTERSERERERVSA